MRHSTAVPPCVRHAIVLLSLVAILNPGFSQESCKVDDAALAGTYEGECKKGLADGQGTAKGSNTYVGVFRKGVPHGTGKYTWANGDVYEGEFKKGKMDGKGVLTISADGQVTTRTGYWLANDYIGTSPTPHRVNYRSSGVMSVNISKTDNTEGERPALYFEILHKGRNVPPPAFSFTEVIGATGNRFTAGRETKIIVTTFPLRFTLGYMGETVDIEITAPMSWKIRLDFNK